METKSNKQIVADFYRDIIRDQKLELLDEYVHDNYIQHSPMLKDGKAALVEALNYLKAIPKPVEPGPSPIVMMIAEDDLVMALLDITFMGKHLSVVDIFRLKDGKVTEHWDVRQDVPEVMPHGNGMF
ncbi:MAG: ester cyclase [Bacteroidota bacterium]